MNTLETETLSKMEITNTDQLEAYLKSQNIKYKSITLLEGGTCNFVFRITDEADKPIIVKHAEPYVATNRQMAFTSERMDFEHAALTAVPKHLSLKSCVSPPSVYNYDSIAHVLLIADSSERTLKASYTDPAIYVNMIGERLGEWLAHLHADTKTADIGDNQAGKGIYRYCYYTMAETLKQHGLDPSIGEKINHEYGSLLLTDDECVCHGDFWPGNILLGETSLTVVDWEMCRCGCGATDVGQFAAEAYLLDRFRGGRGLLPAFLKGYREADNGALNVKRVAVQVGAHLICWPVRVGWGTEEEIMQCIELGVKFLEAVVADDMDWLRVSFLKELL